MLSPIVYNQKADLAIVCPITSQIKDYPFEVRVLASLPKPSVVLVDQIKCIDWRSRAARFIAKAPGPVLAEVEAKLRALLGL